MAQLKNTILTETQLEEMLIKTVRGIDDCLALVESPTEKRATFVQPIETTKDLVLTLSIQKVKDRSKIEQHFYKSIGESKEQEEINKSIKKRREEIKIDAGNNTIIAANTAEFVDSLRPAFKTLRKMVENGKEHAGACVGELHVFEMPSGNRTKRYIHLTLSTNDDLEDTYNEVRQSPQPKEGNPVNIRELVLDLEAPLLSLMQNAAKGDKLESYSVGEITLGTNKKDNSATTTRFLHLTLSNEKKLFFLDTKLAETELSASYQKLVGQTISKNMPCSLINIGTTLVHNSGFDTAGTKTLTTVLMLVPPEQCSIPVNVVIQPEFTLKL